MIPTRRNLLSLSLLAAPGWALPVRAQSFPLRPVRFVLGSAAGSVPGVTTRHIAKHLTLLLGQPVVVENRASAGGIVALEAVKASPPDGHTLSFVHNGNMSVAPSLFKRLPYDPLDNFTHVGIFWRGMRVLVAHPSLEVATLSQLVSLASVRPGTLRYSSPGNATPTHLGMEQFKHVANIDIQHIPYRGPAAQMAVLSGEVDLTLESLDPLLAHIRVGRLVPLAVGGPRRLAALPDVPTFDEQGVAGIGMTWLGVVGPAGMSAPVVARLNRDLAAAVLSPDIRETFEASGRQIAPGTPQDMTATIRDEIPLWREIVVRSGITVN